MCVVVVLSETQQKKQKKGFLASFILIMVISFIELFTVLIDRTPTQYRLLNIICNFFGFALTPMVPLLISFTLDIKRKMNKIVVVAGAYLIFLAIVTPFGGVFHVDSSNTYSRGPLFIIYIVMYLIAIIYLLWVSRQMAERYQNRSRFLLYPIVVFVIFGTTVQIIWPQIHVTWFCITIMSVLYYIYCNEMWQQVDGLTGLLSQKSYFNRVNTLNKESVLLVFDVDEFKSINDNYGHPTGDQCLICIADCIKKAYGKSGYCYRIGGDEFCVLLYDAKNSNSCYSEFISQMDRMRDTLEILPYVSVGMAEFMPGDDILTVKEKSDQNMYIYKRQHKAERNR
ncbi:MAG: diguanylate cyclase [Clostridiales bacterium]|nr:diguanylate cyclase [Clostridiales bacterium]